MTPADDEIAAFERTQTGLRASIAASRQLAEAAEELVQRHKSMRETRARGSLFRAAGAGTPRSRTE